jgi:hypothetical protein
LAWCSHQSYSASNSTSWKCHLALSHHNLLRTAPIPPDLHWLDALIPGVSQDLNGAILRKIKKHQVHRRVTLKKIVYVSWFPWWVSVRDATCLESSAKQGPSQNKAH